MLVAAHRKLTIADCGLRIAEDCGNEIRNQIRNPQSAIRNTTVLSVMARKRIRCALWASRRPPGKARGARIPGVCKRRATKPGGMHRRPECIPYSFAGPYFLVLTSSSMETDGSRNSRHT